jgi:aspartyl-tRNA synthetase
VSKMRESLKDTKLRVSWLCLIRSRNADSKVGFPKESPRLDYPGNADVGKVMTLHGYLTSRKDMSKNMSFGSLQTKDLGHDIQLVAFQKGGSALDKLKAVKVHSPVAVTGLIQKKQVAKEAEATEEVELVLQDIIQLNTAPDDIVASKETRFTPEQRHLQLRYSDKLRDNIKMRSEVAFECRHLLKTRGFTEIETPLLFKSTPEGAREFLVPSRRPGHAYALPQSPQQYKQILMASGIERYFQIAKCFRDEDLRADRQPEFTQLDLEMAFADEETVMETIEAIIGHLWDKILHNPIKAPFKRMTYNEAMSKYGSDKPDLRFGMEIRDVTEHMSEGYRETMNFNVPMVVEAFKFNVPSHTSSLDQYFEDISTTLDLASTDDGLKIKPFHEASPGSDGAVVYFHKFGPDMIDKELSEGLNKAFDGSLQAGDVIVTKARPADLLLNGTSGSTELGRLRLGLHRRLVAQQILDPLRHDEYNFLWITDFPLLSIDDESSPGTLVSTHHPFTAPKTVEDIDLLITNPTRAVAAHYDLVLNGVELGGGSRRIHDAKLQEFLLRNILNLPDHRIEDFRHLLKVLDSGCPPHAGIALGFDRLVAVMSGTNSVRDVIAFPKTGRGEDPLVGSPSEMTEGQLATYHLERKSR